MTFPEPVLLVSDQADQSLAEALAGTAVECCCFFSDPGTLRERYSAIIVNYPARPNDGEALRQAVDWVNMNLAPKAPPSRPPLWL